jgi:hypothetical protein
MTHSILGLDISTSVIGYTVLDGDPDCPAVHQIGHIDFKKCKDLWDKVDVFETFINKIRITNIYPANPLADVYIEEALISFRPGFSNAQTITTLVKFNAMCSLIVRRMFGFDPKYVGAPTARRLCGIKTQTLAKAGMSVKEQVFTWARNGPLKDRQWTMTKTGRYQPWNMDETDSYVIARAGLVLERQSSEQ